MIGNLEILSRLLMAALLGSVIGFERERLNWAAGLRTHMLVCVGASLMMMVSAFGFADALTQKNVVLDPSRVAAQVVSGIGFLGAGSILLRGEVVRGLTTAASLWSVAGIGLAVAEGCTPQPLVPRSSSSLFSPGLSRLSVALFRSNNSATYNCWRNGEVFHWTVCIVRWAWGAFGSNSSSFNSLKMILSLTMCRLRCRAHLQMSLQPSVRGLER